MSIYVFLGPSLPRAEARTLLDAVYLPPAKAGDIYSLMSKKPRAIGLVDGLFEQVPAVWHKEILYALSCGVHVFGASSMGALRAAELHPFGMRGVGQVFEAFRSGTLTDDDEVTIAHAPGNEEFRPLSEAMVNIRLGLQRALAASVISPATSELLCAAAKGEYYMSRSWAAAFAIGRERGAPESELSALRQFLREHPCDAKREDARELLRQLRELQAAETPPHAPNFVFEKTCFWDVLCNSTKRTVLDEGTDGAGVGDTAVHNYIKLTREDQPGIARAGLLYLLAELLSSRLNIHVTEEQIAATAERFRRTRGLMSAKSTQEWLERNHLTHEKFSELIRLEALVEDLMQRYALSLGEKTQFELARRGELGAMMEAVEARTRKLRELGILVPSPGDTGIETEELLRWFRERFNVIPGGQEELSRVRSFDSEANFLVELAAEYLFQQAAGAGSASGGA